MIARIWEGTVPTAKAEAYLELMRRVALPDYRSIPGNLNAWCLHRRDGEVVRVQMLTFWTGLDAIRAFAGEDYERAKYYDFDDAYLLEKPERVVHFVAED
jgi:heme-degrading monooxygenase HmoA